MNKGITKENLLLIIPPALKQDPSIMALAAADAEVLADRLKEIDRVRLIPNIDGLDEAVLDILARDFKVDWWDPEYSIDEKRRTLKGSWLVHKTLGTKAAVETAASAVYPMTYVQEWFEYGGEPYHFRLNVDLPEDEWTPERHKRLMWRLQYYKNLRSHLDSVAYQIQPVVLENQQAVGFAALRIHAGASNFDRTAQFGQTDESGLALAAVTARTGVANRFSVSAALTWRGPWRLDGMYRLDGQRRLDAGIGRSAL